LNGTARVHPGRQPYPPKQAEKCGLAATLARNYRKRFFDCQKKSQAVDRFKILLAQRKHRVSENLSSAL
jgi:hypothetical protein